MQYRRFGKTDRTVSEVGFGCARIGGLFQASRQAQLRLLRAALEAGITFYDTADMYAQGESERLLGAAFAGQRDRVVIATKVGYTFSPQRRLLSRIKPVLKPVVTRLGLRRNRWPRQMLTTAAAQDFSPGYITRMIEGSLTRLGTDYVDLLQLHSPPVEVLERGDFLPAVEALQRDGKIRSWGVACEEPEDALLCLAYPGLASIQVSLSLLHPRALETAIPRATQRGVGVIARQVFASGRLTRSDDARPQQALDFVLEQPGVSVALLGMHTQAHLEANLRMLGARAAAGSASMVGPARAEE